MMHIKISRHDTDIAVLKSQIMSDKLAHDREMKDVKEALRSIAAKLDNIEQALRERWLFFGKRGKYLFKPKDDWAIKIISGRYKGFSFSRAQDSKMFNIVYRGPAF